LIWGEDHELGVRFLALVLGSVFMSIITLLKITKYKFVRHCWADDECAWQECRVMNQFTLCPLVTMFSFIFSAFFKFSTAMMHLL
jgi:hypothetical protein